MLSSSVTELTAAPADPPAPGAASGPLHWGLSPPLVPASAATQEERLG